ncbi:MAG: hypothetical protein C0601_09300 [Candidatus Muiribacterium halophilum]|uniref:FlgD Ig-like domain-containing protein n=1 Tax=Muiribacterium halophilum TaxID=2053465 RepID=A0A2N5ZDL6_MUIH1|nr:MAG: hypothetical protein C0601_09300 [Candidatus Muirbacterium halophilum]
MSKRLYLIFFLTFILTGTLFASEIALVSNYSKVAKGDILEVKLRISDLDSVQSLSMDLEYTGDITFYDWDQNTSGIQGKLLNESYTTTWNASSNTMNITFNFNQARDITLDYPVSVLFSVPDNTTSSSLSFKLKNFIKNQNITSITTNTLNVAIDNEGVVDLSSEPSTIYSISGLKFEISENTFNDTRELSVKETDLNTEGYSQFVPQGDSSSSPLNVYYKITVNGNIKTQRFMNVYFPFDSSQVPAGYSPEDIKIYYFNETTLKWERIGGKVESIGGNSYFVKASFNHFSLFTLLADKYEFPGNTIEKIEVLPNPFSPNGNGKNDVVSIKFNLKNKSTVTLGIYDRVGREIRRIVTDKEYNSGDNVIEWDGTSDIGSIVTTGLYLFNFKVKDESGRNDKKTGTIIVSKNMKE